MSRRPTIGIISCLLLIVGVGIFFFGPEGDVYRALCGACIRVGAVLFALWLAFPEVSRVPSWLYGCSLAILVVIAAKPRSIFFLGPALIAIWFLRPRPPK